MKIPFDSLGKLIGSRRPLPQVDRRYLRSYQCRCGNPIFFRNTSC